MSTVGSFFTAWRVRLGYPLAIAVLLFARPTLASILIGALVGLLGLMIRALAAGHLRKQELLTVSGPYAYTRNPLYFGSAILAVGIAIATYSWISSTLLCGYFALFYSVVMRREECELRQHFGAAFEEYARAVPLFFPRLFPAKFARGNSGSFSFAQYKKNHEWQAAAGFVLLLVVLVLLWRVRMPMY